jgi:predicted Fe-Mo cluster-binding NifX family protein
VKIAFTTSGDTLNSSMESRFGRARKFIIYDFDSETFEVIDNEKSMDAAEGSGIQAAYAVAGKGVHGLVTGQCGPKAYRALYTAGVWIYHTDASTVTEALSKYRLGKLPLAESSDADSHAV